MVVEEKYKDIPVNREEDESSSDDESEDEDGFLATEDLDVQISATLNAIRSKDPRVYDKDVTFYRPEQQEPGASRKEKNAKPVTIRDYQREKLLRGDIGASDDENDTPKTYMQEQVDLKQSIVSEINAAGLVDSEGDSEDEGFMKRKEPAKTTSSGVHASRTAKIKPPSLDVANADKDPEGFLSNFLAARAWVPEEGGKWSAFESDDGEGADEEAEKFEQAYNLRFEDPKKSNEVLKSYSRDLTASRSVRREDKSGRKRQRELEREQKEAQRRERHEEKARLRKLKLDESAEKLRKIKLAAGKSGKDLTDADWMRFLDDAWENEKWEEEMNKRFGDDYYAQKDEDMEASDAEMGGAENAKTKRKLPKKPSWDDDIDINDIVPDFEDSAKPSITLSDVEEEDLPAHDDADASLSNKKHNASDRKKARIENQRKVRQERSKLEALVDSKMEQNYHPLLDKTGSTSSSSMPSFRYRETSPESFGMTARDILLAPSDQHLNEYAGLKKLASFRDDEKKRRDKKKLGKKARLRQWRRDVFGREFEQEGPTYGFERLVAVDNTDSRDLGKEIQLEDAGDAEPKKKKRKRSKTKSTGTANETSA